MEKIVRLTVNGEPHSVAVRPSETLLETLREQLQLTGTKRGCDFGDCGTCTVLLDGEAVKSCLVLTVAADGRDVQTIEGLQHNGRMHPLQRAFIAHGAIQCGYCTPGMVMAAKALVDRVPDPSVDDVKFALGGNLCRCTGYKRIIEAVRDWRRFSGDDAPELEHHDDTRHAVVGRSVPRSDAPAKVTGRAIFTEDILLPGLLHGRILGSPHPHALITSIDTSAAEALPGVKAVITGKDVSDVLYGVSPARYDEHVLAKDKVRFVGDEVAAVAAVDEATAEEAVQLIKVEYELLPAVLDPFAALADDAPDIHEAARGKHNVNTLVDHHFGDVDKGFAEADVVLAERFVGNFVYQSPLEPHCSIAEWDHTRDAVTVWSSTQVPHYLQKQLARVFEHAAGQVPNQQALRRRRLRWQGRDDGARLLRLLPVAGDRPAGEDDLLAAGDVLPPPRPPQAVHGPEDRRQQGRPDHGGRLLQRARRRRLHQLRRDHRLLRRVHDPDPLPHPQLPLPRPPHVHQQTSVRRDARPRRAPAPVRVREPARHARREARHRPDRHPHGQRDGPEHPHGQRPRRALVRVQGDAQTVRERSGWDAKQGKLPYGRGIGVGCGGFVSGAGYPIYRSQFPHSNAIIRVLEDGEGATLLIAAAEIGQGSETVLTQVAAEALGLAYGDVTMAQCDTSIAPIDLGSYSSRVTLMAGTRSRWRPTPSTPSSTRSWPASWAASRTPCLRRTADLRHRGPPSRHGLRRGGPALLRGERPVGRHRLLRAATRPRRELQGRDRRHLPGVQLRLLGVRGRGRPRDRQGQGGALQTPTTPGRSSTRSPTTARSRARSSWGPARCCSRGSSSTRTATS